MNEQQRKSMESTMRDIGRVLKNAMPPGVAFCLVLASIGEKGWTTYMSSVEREDAINLLKELIHKMEEERS